GLVPGGGRAANGRIRRGEEVALVAAGLRLARARRSAARGEGDRGGAGEEGAGGGGAASGQGPHGVGGRRCVDLSTPGMARECAEAAAFPGSARRADPRAPPGGVNESPSPGVNRVNES